MLSHSSTQQVSSSPRFWGLHAQTCLLSSAHRFLMGLRSGDWLGHSSRLMLLSPNYFLMTLAVCLGSLSCWEMKPWCRWSCCTDCRRFSWRISIYSTAFMVPLMQTRWPGPCGEKHHHSMLLPPPCLSMGMVLQDLKASPARCQTILVVLWQKSSILVLSDQMTLLQSASVIQMICGKLEALPEVSLALQGDLSRTLWVETMTSQCSGDSGQWNACCIAMGLTVATTWPQTSWRASEGGHPAVGWW